MYSHSGAIESLPFATPVALSEAQAIMHSVGCRVQAGFPSPAEDHRTKRIDLTEILITHPQATYLMRVGGDSMRDAGIHDGDVLVVDRAIKPRHNHIVVAVVDSEFTVKYLHQRAGRIKLKPANPTFPDIVPKDGQTVEIWGVVTSAIKRFPV